MDIDIIRLIGCVAIVSFAIGLLAKIKRIIYVHLMARRFGDIKNLSGYGKWAVVTGSTDGIGKGYAKELAKRNMNVLLISRNAEKLEATKNEIMNESKNIEVKTLAFDFGLADLAKYDIIKDAIKDLAVGVLVNNVGSGNEYPEYFLDHPDAEKHWNRMLKINCESVTEMTFIVLPQMLERGEGAIINVASAAAFNSTALFSVYSATKAYVSFFTQGLIKEYKNRGRVYIQCVYPYFVATNLSKIKKTSFFVPDPTYYASCALDTVGLESETTGCLSHALQGLIYSYMPKFVYDFVASKVLLETRSKYLRRNAKKEE